MNKKKLENLSLFERLEFKLDSIYLLQQTDLSILRWSMLAFALCGFVFGERDFLLYGVLFIAASTGIEAILVRLLKDSLAKKYIALVEDREKEKNGERKNPNKL